MVYHRYYIILYYTILYYTILYYTIGTVIYNPNIILRCEAISWVARASARQPGDFRLEAASTDAYYLCYCCYYHYYYNHYYDYYDYYLYYY